jgi:DNA-binding CsgD family transcriptional regulator
MAKLSRPDGGICTSTTSVGLLGTLNKSLRTAVTMVEKADREEKRVKRERKRAEELAPAKYKVVHTDEQVLNLIRQNLNHGKSRYELADELGVSRNQVARWIDGENRGHLRRQVDEEIYRARKG